MLIFYGIKQRYAERGKRMNTLYTTIPNVDKPVSRILYGTGSEPFLSGGDCGELLDKMLALGINTIDTARAYKDAETVIGSWIEQRNNRDNIVILSKCAHPSENGRKRINEKEIREDLKTSLSNLKTDYIDIYLLHRDDPCVPAGEIAEILNALHAEGRMGAFGGSNWTHERIEAVNEYAYAHNLMPFSVSSPNFGLANQIGDPWDGTCVTVSGPANKAARVWYEKNNMPVIAYSSLGRGLFSGRLKSGEADNAGKILDEAAMKGYGYPDNFERLRRCEIIARQKGMKVPQIAMAWLFSQRMNTFAVVSTSSAERMKENIDALNCVLTEEECRFLDLELDI